MIGQSSSKPSPDFANINVVTSDQTGAYTFTGSWANVGNGFSVTVPKDGQYIAVAQFTVQSQGVNGDMRCALAIDGTNDDTTGKRIYTGSADNNYYPVHLQTKPTDMTNGQVITVRGIDAGGDGGIVYSNGIYEGYIALIQVSGFVPTIPNDWQYSTTETCTGKRWRDNKLIYRKCFNGTTANSGSTTTIALGVDIDQIVDFNFFIYDSGGDRWYNTAGSFNNPWAAIKETANQIEYNNGSAPLQNAAYEAIIEYTKN